MCSSQPVVPITMFTPSAAMPSTFRGTAAGIEKSMATSMPRKFSAVMPSTFGVVELVQLQRDLEAVLRRELLDQPAHLAVADDRRASGMHGLVAFEDRRIEVGEELVVQRFDRARADPPPPPRS